MSLHRDTLRPIIIRKYNDKIYRIQVKHSTKVVIYIYLKKIPKSNLIVYIWQ